jgi:hypothetical protein
VKLDYDFSLNLYFILLIQAFWPGYINIFIPTYRPNLFIKNLEDQEIKELKHYGKSIIVVSSLLVDWQIKVLCTLFKWVANTDVIVLK